MDDKNNIKGIKIILIFVLLIGVMASLSLAKISFFEKDKRFDVDDVLLKLSIKEGGNLSKVLKITNYIEGNFEIEKNNLDFVSVSEKEFRLKEREEKVIELDFNINGKEAGVYFGSLVISNGDSLEIPIILEIETEEILFDGNINVPLEYINVYPGGNAVIENTIFNLENIGLQNVEVSYAIKSFDGKIIFSDQENIGVETQLLNTKVVSISEDMDVGNYLFVSIVKYKGSVGTSSYFFRISEKESFHIEGSLLMWLVIFLLIGLIFFIVYYTRQRDDVLLELRRQCKCEMKKLSLTAVKEKEVMKKLSPKKKKKMLKNISKKRLYGKRAINKIYRERVDVIKKLRKNKNKSGVSKKLEQWKKEGYNVGEILVKYGKKVRLKKRIEKYKKEGYDL